MSKRLAKKIAQQHIELRYPQQPLRLQPDYGEKNAADFLGEDEVISEHEAGMMLLKSLMTLVWIVWLNTMKNLVHT